MVPCVVRLVNIYLRCFFRSSVTKIPYYTVVRQNSSMDCTKAMLPCGVQYVGETSQNLRGTMNNHRIDWKNGQNFTSITILVQMDALKTISASCSLKK